MPSLWELLTGRGRLVSITAVLLALAGWWWHEPELDWLALGLALIVIVALAVVALARPREAVRRDVARPLVTVGEEVEVSLEVDRRHGWRHGVRLYEDEAPPELGGGPRFRIPAFGGQTQRRIAYRLPALRRGRYVVGPLAVDVRDPLGLARVDFAHGTTTAVSVAPAIVELPAGLLTGQGSQRGGDAPQRVGTNGQDDVVVREYRHGDSLRKVHWRLSAKAGELMVRREEQTWEEAATVVLDTRLAPHAGDAADDSFEWAVAATASLAARLSASGRRVDILGPRGALFTTPASHRVAVVERALRETLAGVSLEQITQLSGAAAAIGSSPAQLVVAVLAQCSAADAMLLGEALGQRRRGVALILDTASFGTPHGPRDVAGEPLLRERGWSVHPVVAGMSLGAALTDAGRAGAARAGAAGAAR